jgi:hypothetical protein
MNHTRRVVTYQSDGASRINICSGCEERFVLQTNTWPKDLAGREYATVYRGVHYASCSFQRLSLIANQVVDGFQRRLPYLRLVEHACVEGIDTVVWTDTGRQLYTLRPHADSAEVFSPQGRPWGALTFEDASAEAAAAVAIVATAIRSGNHAQGPV